jgi:hypothetical protein
MYRADEVPPAYRQFFFVNSGGPLRKVLGRQVIEKRWHLLTLECGDRVLLPGYRRAARVGCGFCGGLEPLAEQPA